MYRKCFHQLVAVVLVFTVADGSWAEDHRELEKYLTDDVVAVGYLDLSKIDTLGLLDWAVELGLVLDEERGEAVRQMMAAQERLDELVDFGAPHVYALFRVSDFGHGGPTWVVPVAKSGSPQAVLGLILSGKPDKQELERAAQVPGLPLFWEIIDGAVVGGMTVAQVEQAKKARIDSPRDLGKAWSALGQGGCGLLVFGDKDSRRVVREMFPPLPEPFAAINGSLLADGLQWGGFAINLLPQLSVKIVIEGEDSQFVETVGQAISSGLARLNLLPQVQEALDEADREALLLALTPQVEGMRIQIDLESATNDVERLVKIVGPPIHKARQTAWRNSRMNQFKHIGLAIHNYADRNKEMFPAHANYDDNGKPLLSWRVLILPYLDQGELYKQFHLDEPWDSEHNRKLIEKLPAVYADPGSALRKINAKGQTTFVVPVSKGTVFDRPTGTMFKEIMDGTSNTIMFVEVVPERAVVWTKPEDWKVDLEDPLNGVKREDRDWFTAARCDGSVHIMSNEVGAKKLRALLTRAGKEIIEWP